MNHADLPTVATAQLPERYEAAKIALNECNRIDECKDWGDKAAALASYARQSDDKTMEHTAMRIRARAIRRCGELLKEFERANGANQNIKGGASPKVPTRKDAAREAGLSPDQAKNAIRVANVDEDSFEEQVESDTPPTITSLAVQGMHKGIPIYVGLGVSEAPFRREREEV